MASTPQVQNKLANENEIHQKSLAQVVQPSPSLIINGPSQFPQGCLHKSLNSFPTTNNQSSLSSEHLTSTGSGQHNHFNALHHKCSFQLSDPEHINHADFTHYHSAHNRPSSGHHTSQGFLHHRVSSSSKYEARLKLSSRSSSYEKSSIFSKSASSSKAASPMPSPHVSPCPSPCPSLITLADPTCSPDRPCSPAQKKKIMVLYMNRLSADSRPQQRGKSVSLYGCVFACSTKIY